jgi:uncharacterized membrane-anchored protein YitT (DUF2179 family)
MARIPLMKVQMSRILKQPWQNILLDYAQLTLGSLLLALAYNVFYIPNEVVSGGISGIGVIVHHLLTWPVGVVTLLLNIPLFLAGLRWGGGITTGIRTIYAVIVMSLAIDLLAPWLPSVTDSPLLFITYGGLLDGLGVGLVLRAQGTTGGTDIIGRLLRRFTGLEISRGVFIANVLIIGAAAIIFGMEQAMYGIMVAAVSSYAIDFVLAGGRRARQALIISERWAEVRDAILTEMERGVTILPARGAYTGSERPILLCVVNPTEIAQVRRLVMSFDPQAFVVITATSEVWGEGFAPIHGEI